jgi:hypothetical protein
MGHRGQDVGERATAAVTPKLWEMSDMVKVLEDWENDTTFRGS